MAKTYKEGHVEIEDEFEAYSYVPCTSCELDFLLLLDGKSEITEEDVKNLLCIDNGCDDNAEFRQFYNEVLIKSFNKNPDLFSREVYGLTSQNYDSILTELQSPVNDEITASPENLNSYFINRIQ